MRDDLKQLKALAKGSGYTISRDKTHSDYFTVSSVTAPNIFTASYIVVSDFLAKHKHDSQYY